MSKIKTIIAKQGNDAQNRVRTIIDELYTDRSVDLQMKRIDKIRELEANTNIVKHSNMVMRRGKRNRLIELYVLICNTIELITLKIGYDYEV